MSGRAFTLPALQHRRFLSFCVKGVAHPQRTQPEWYFFSSSLELFKLLFILCGRSFADDTPCCPESPPIAKDSLSTGNQECAAKVAAIQAPRLELAAQRVLPPWHKAMHFRRGRNYHEKRCFEIIADPSGYMWGFGLPLDRRHA